MAKTFAYRTKATQRYAGTTAGFYNDFVHVAGKQSTGIAITPAGGYVLQRLCINTTQGGGNITLKCGSDTIAVIGTGNGAGDRAYNCYLYDQLWYFCDSTITDVTLVISRGTPSIVPGATSTSTSSTSSSTSSTSVSTTSVSTSSTSTSITTSSVSTSSTSTSTTTL